MAAESKDTEATAVAWDKWEFVDHETGEPSGTPSFDEVLKVLPPKDSKALNYAEMKAMQDRIKAKSGPNDPPIAVYPRVPPGWSMKDAGEPFLKDCLRKPTTEEEEDKAIASSTETEATTAVKALLTDGKVDPQNKAVIEGWLPFLGPVTMPGQETNWWKAYENRKKQEKMEIDQVTEQNKSQEQKDQEENEKKKALRKRNKKTMNRNLQRCGLPQAIVRCFSDVKFHAPYRLTTYGKLEINQVIAHKVIDYKLDLPSGNGSHPTSKKMHAILCCNLSKANGTVRICCLPEDNDPTCMMWAFQSNTLVSFTMILGNGATTNSVPYGHMNKTQYAATVATIAELLK